MKRKATQKLLADLNKRVQANQVGLLALFEATAAPLKNGKVTLNTLRVACSQGLPEFKDAIKLMYKEEELQELQDAVSASGFDFFGFFGSVLAGIGNGLGLMSTSKGTDAELQIQLAQSQLEIEKAKAESTQKTITLIIGAVVVLAIIAAIIFIVKKTRK